MDAQIVADREANSINTLGNENYVVAPRWNKITILFHFLLAFRAKRTD